MAERGVSFSPIKWFGLVITIIALTNIAILLDIPVLRQFLAFLYLTFVPGLLIVYILKLNRIDLTTRIVLSAGLSIAFSMLFGILITSLLFILGCTKPLSITLLLISFAIATVTLATVAYIRNKNISLSFSNIRLTTAEKALLIVPSLLPLLSIVGMRLMNSTDNNILLVAMLLLIPAYVIFLSVSNHRVSPKVYPATIFLIGISLLLMYSLRSNHIIGSDTHREFLIFQTTLDNFHWRQLGFGPLDTCLSISVLPMVYQAFLNTNQEFLFKILYSIIVSFTPLAVYILSRKYIGSLYAFLASVFFMSQVIFLWTPSVARTNTAVLFFALAIMVLFNDDISELAKRALFIIFTTSTIASHYGATYIFFFILVLTWVGTQVISHTRGLATPSNVPHQFRIKQGITPIAAALFLAMIFFWYSQMTGPTFSIGTRFIETSFISWAIESRGEVTQAALGGTLLYIGVPQKIEFIFSWLTIALIAIGVLTTIGKFKAMVSLPGSIHRKTSFLLKKFEVEYLVLAIMCCTLLAVALLLAYVTRYYGTTKAYFQLMAPLSIFFVIGGIMVARWLRVKKSHWIILAVLVPYFLCTTGVMGLPFDYPRTITLSSEGPLYTSMFIHDQESYAAKWIKEYGREETTIYASGFIQDVLLSQGKIPMARTDSRLIPRYQEGSKIDGYIYLRYADIADGGLVTKYPGIFAGKSKIYANGGSEIYK